MALGLETDPEKWDETWDEKWELEEWDPSWDFQEDVVDPRQLHFDTVGADSAGEVPEKKPTPKEVDSEVESYPMVSGFVWDPITIWRRLSLAPLPAIVLDNMVNGQRFFRVLMGMTIVSLVCHVKNLTNQPQKSWLTNSPEMRRSNTPRSARMPLPISLRKLGRRVRSPGPVVQGWTNLPVNLSQQQRRLKWRGWNIKTNLVGFYGKVQVWPRSLATNRMPTRTHLALRQSKGWPWRNTSFMSSGTHPLRTSRKRFPQAFPNSFGKNLLKSLRLSTSTASLIQRLSTSFWGPFGPIRIMAEIIVWATVSQVSVFRISLPNLYFLRSAKPRHGVKVLTFTDPTTDPAGSKAWV